MKRECDLLAGADIIRNLEDVKLPFGEWLRASPFKKASVSSGYPKQDSEPVSMRRKFFEKFKKNILDENDLEEEDDDKTEQPKITKKEDAGVDLVCRSLEEVLVGGTTEKAQGKERNQEKEENEKLNTPSYVKKRIL